MIRVKTVVILLALCASPVSAQRRAFDLTTPRPIAAADKVWISWTAADSAWPSLGIPKTVDEGIHDDYSVNSIIATVDPDKIRLKQRQDAGKASINGQTLLPIETTIANGKKLVEIRASLTVEAIRKALAAE